MSGYLNTAANLVAKTIKSEDTTKLVKAFVKAGEKGDKSLQEAIIASTAAAVVQNSAPPEVVAVKEPNVKQPLTNKELFSSNAAFATLTGIGSAVGSVANAVPAVAVVNTVAQLLESPAGQELLSGVAGIVKDPGKFGEGLGHGIEKVGVGSGIFVDKTTKSVDDAIQRMSKTTITITDDAVNNAKSLTKGAHIVAGTALDTGLMVQEKVIGTVFSGIGKVQEGIFDFAVKGAVAPFKYLARGFKSLKGEMTSEETKVTEEATTQEAYRKAAQDASDKAFSAWAAAKQKRYGRPPTEDEIKQWETENPISKFTVTLKRSFFGSEEPSAVDMIKVALLIIFIIFIILFLVYIAAPEGCPDLYFPLLGLGCIFIIGFIAKTAMTAK